MIWGDETLENLNLGQESEQKLSPIKEERPREDRSMPLRDLVNLSIETIYGLKPVDDQQLNQLLSTLVRTKALTADESYLLRDQLQDLEHFERAIDDRISTILKKKGLLDQRTVEEIHDFQNGAHQKTI